MKTIYMGTNTDPYWLRSDEAISRWTKEGNETEVLRWRTYHTMSLSLRDQIVSEIEENGQCQLSWRCMGRTRHSMHAQNWAKAMPEYEFLIGNNYQCIVRKRK